MIDESGLILVRVEVREQGHVAHVMVNNPERRNVLGIAGKKALTEIFRQLAKDALLRVAVLEKTGHAAEPWRLLRNVLLQVRTRLDFFVRHVVPGEVPGSRVVAGVAPPQQETGQGDDVRHVLGVVPGVELLLPFRRNVGPRRHQCFRFDHFVR